MTNYELIQEMKPYQLAEFLRKVSDGETEFTVCDRECESCANDVEMCEALIERWLKEDCENLIAEKPIELEPWRKIITRPLNDEIYNNTLVDWRKEYKSTTSECLRKRTEVIYMNY